jgi:hypothetical protein
MRWTTAILHVLASTSPKECVGAGEVACGVTRVGTSNVHWRKHAHMSLQERIWYVMVLMKRRP